MADSGEAPPWMVALPTAPEYHPTVKEFKDPVAYLTHIEPEASKYGICKIIPPALLAPPKSASLNFSRSIKHRSRPAGSDAFETRRKKIGSCSDRAPSPVESGGRCTLAQFEAKAKKFERGLLRRRFVSEVEVETAYWAAWAGEVLTVECAEGVSASAFPPVRAGGRGGTVGESVWNMRRVSKWEMSPLRFLKGDVPGVTSPVVDVGMLFSWFGWHVEDHDLYSLDYLHFGAGKTWYGVPRDSGYAFEEVVRMNVYGEEVNRLTTFAILAEKTTVMSPEVLLGVGVPCCRLVQNAGEFVVTFPGAYHTGFSHGFNCAEASKIATPGWFKVAKEAARRRASINYPPMLSHIQLLYNLALALSSSVPKRLCSQLRTTRLKDKKRSGELAVEHLFIEDMMQNNELLHALLKGGSSCVILPQRSFELPLSSSSCLQLRVRRMAKSGDSILIPCGGKQVSSRKKRRSSNFNRGISAMRMKETDCGTRTAVLSDELFDDGLLSCVTCGLSNFACVALIQPKKADLEYLISTAGSVDSGINHNQSSRDSGSAISEKEKIDSLVDISVQWDGYQLQVTRERVHHESSQHSGLNIIKGDGKIVQSGDPFNLNAAGGDLRTISVRISQSQESILKEMDFGYKPSFQPSGVSKCKLKRNRVVCSFNRPKESFTDTTVKDEASILMCQKSIKDNSTVHTFCLEHAMEVEQELRMVGGTNILLVCHPDYPNFEKKAKELAEKLAIDHDWKCIHLREVGAEDKRKIQAIFDYDGIPCKGDWTVQLGINLYNSSSLSRYNKQMHFHPVIHKLFGQDAPHNIHEKINTSNRSKQQQEVVVAGNLCGKVWMSNQLHPYLAFRQNEEENAGCQFDLTDTANEVKVEVDDCILSENPTVNHAQKRKIPFEKNTAKKVKHEQHKMNSGGRGEELRAKFSSGNKSKRVLNSRSGKKSTHVAMILHKKFMAHNKNLNKKYENEAGLSKSIEYEKDAVYECDTEGCTMGFPLKLDLVLHRNNLCLVEGCRRKFISHDFLLQHRLVHMVTRPLKCPWKGCDKTFKWASARAEHMWVHTGAKTYVCKKAGCGQVFHFLSGFSIHKQKTGHSDMQLR